MAVPEAMVAVGTLADLRFPLADLTETATPNEASDVILEQTCATDALSEELTLLGERTPSATVPPEPEKVPSQGVAAAWAPTLKVMVELINAFTLAWSSSVMKTEPPPGSSFTQVIR